MDDRISYNLENHIQLLKDEKMILSQNKSFFRHNRDKFLELLQYNVAVEAHIFWEDRFEIASLIQVFLNKEMTAKEFHDSVFGFRRNHLEKCKKFLANLVSEEIKEFAPNKESYKLEGFLSSLYSECESFEMDSDEETFYNSIRNKFLEFQKVLNEE